MLREFCPVIGASHAEGEASSSIAPWRLSASVQHHLIALSLLTASDHASPRSSAPFFFPVFNPLFAPLIYPPYVCSLFRLPSRCEEHPSPAPPLHLFFFSPKPHPLTYPQLIFPDLLSFLSPPRHAPALMWELRCCACGAAALAWGSALVPRGVLLLLPLQTGRVGEEEEEEGGKPGSVLGWKDEQLEGWRPVGAGGGHGGHSHSKPWLPAQRCGVKEDHASGAEKELLFPRGSQRTQPCSQPSRLSQTTSPSFSPHVITFPVFLCTATGIITFVLRRRNNI